MGRRSGAQRAKSQYYTSDLSLPARASAMPASAACLSCGRTLLTAVFALASLVVLSGDNALAQGSVAGDRLALVALYNATDGANWTNNTNWLTNEAISEWHGVETDEDGRVRELNLNANKLSGEIPEELGGLTDLQELWLSHNELSGEIPTELGNLTNLEWLDLSKNELSGEIPAELGNLTSLTLLFLHENELSGEIPTELGSLTSLKRLYLTQNMLSGAIPVALGKLTNLEYLSLSQNELSGEIPVELGNLTSLYFLALSRNMLSGEIPAALGDLTSLQELSLWSNELSGEIPTELGSLTSLKRLYLTQNMLSGAIPAALGDLSNLRQLYLNQNMLSGAIPVALGKLTNLEQLSLSQNELSGAIPAELGDLASLQILYLNGNADLAGPLPLTLSALSQLSVLDIRETTLCAPADTEFRAWLATIDFQGAVCAPPPPPPPSPGGGGGGPPSGGGGPRQTVPDTPTNLMADATDGTVTLAWEAPKDDGGSAVTDYQYRINSRGDWISIGSTNTTHTVTGLTNGVTYVFEVRAVNRVGRSRASEPVEARPRAPAVLDFTHFANGDSTISEMVLVNVAPYPIQPTLYFYDQEGTLIDPEAVVDITGDLEIAEDGSLSVSTEMEPLGELTIATHGRGEPVSGSVRVVSDGPIGGFLRFDIPGIGVAGVGASAPVQDALFPARRQAGGIRTAAALHNLEAEAMGVSCRLMRGGVALEAAEIPLEANGQTAWFIEDVFTATDTSDFAGSVRCIAPGRGRFTAIAAEIDAAGGIFTTLPVMEVNRGRAEVTTLDFAHFANGTWITDLVFLNLETELSGPALTPFHRTIPPTRPAIYFYDTEGTLIDPGLLVDITGDLEITDDGALTVRTEMEPLGVLTMSTHGRGEIVSGSVKVVSDGPIGGMVRFLHPALGVAGVGASPPVSDALFPVRRQEGGITTGVAIHNLESSSGLVRCELMREGVLLDAVPIPLAANGQQSRFIDEMFPATDTSDFVGSVRCTVPDGGLFTGVAVELDAANRIFTTLPVVPVMP